MTSSSNLILQHYIKLTEFLGKALGPDYEVALHDLTRKDRSIIAIANNYISGREVGAPLTNMALSSLRDKIQNRFFLCQTGWNISQDPWMRSMLSVPQNHQSLLV